MPFFESCNVNYSTKDGRLSTARALSSPHPSVLGRVFKSGAMMRQNRETSYISVSSQYVGTKMTISVLLFRVLIALGKN